MTLHKHKMVGSVTRSFSNVNDINDEGFEYYNQGMWDVTRQWLDEE
jgi:hypothetical protein